MDSSQHHHHNLMLKIHDVHGQDSSPNQSHHSTLSVPILITNQVGSDFMHYSQNRS